MDSDRAHDIREYDPKSTHSWYNVASDFWPFTGDVFSFDYVPGQRAKSDDWWYRQSVSGSCIVYHSSFKKMNNQSSLFTQLIFIRFWTFSIQLYRINPFLVVVDQLANLMIRVGFIRIQWTLSRTTIYEKTTQKHSTWVVMIFVWKIIPRIDGFDLDLYDFATRVEKIDL